LELGCAGWIWGVQFGILTTDEILMRRSGWKKSGKTTYLNKRRQKQENNTLNY